MKPTDELFTGYRHCPCGATVGAVVCGHFQPNKNYGGTVAGEHRCRKHKEIQMTFDRGQS